MKPLKSFDFYGRYSGYSRHDSYCSSFLSLEQILERLRIEENPFKFENYVLGIVQVYLDLSIERQKNAKITENAARSTRKAQKELLDSILLAGKKTVGSLYRGAGINREAIELILAEKEQLSYQLHPNSRHLEGKHKEVQSFGLYLPKLVQNTGNPDTLVCVLSGALEPSFLVMDILEKDTILPLRYSYITRSDSEVRVPSFFDKALISDNIRMKNCLLIEDIILTAKSIVKTAEYVAQFNPKNLYGACVYSNTNFWSRALYSSTMKKPKKINSRPPAYKFI